MNAADIYTRARLAGDNEELWLAVAALLDMLEARAEKAEAALRSVRAHGDLTQISDYFAALEEQSQ